MADQWAGSYLADEYGEDFVTLPGISIEKAIWHQHRDGEHCDWCYIIKVHGVELLTVHESGVELEADLMDLLNRHITISDLHQRARRGE